MSNVIEFPTQKQTTEVMFPTYYFADTDDTVIPELPADPDVAAGIIASWIILLTGYKVLTPDDVIDTVKKVFPNSERIIAKSEDK